MRHERREIDILNDVRAVFIGVKGAADMLGLSEGGFRSALKAGRIKLMTYELWGKTLFSKDEIRDASRKSEGERSMAGSQQGSTPNSKAAELDMLKTQCRTLGISTHKKNREQMIQALALKGQRVNIPSTSIGQTIKDKLGL